MEGNGAAEREEAIPLADRHPPLLWVTRRLQLHLDALREILKDFLPHANEMESKHLSVDSLVHLENLPNQKRIKLQAYIDERFAEARAGDPPPHPNNGNDAGGGPENVSIQIDLSEIEQIIDDRHFTNQFVSELENMMAGPRRVTILQNSLLAMAAGAFEVLVAGVATRFYVKHPDALDSDEKSFSMAELRDFGDLDDAADEMIARRITDLMYGGLDSWSDWFKKRCSVDLSDLAMDFDSVTEAFQRRHVVLHNGGLASRQYLRSVPSSDARVGDRLLVDSDYLDATFDQMDVLGTSLGVMAEGTWHPEMRDDAAGQLLRRCFELMVEDRWLAAQTLARTGKDLKCQAAIKQSLQCNEWLCRAERDGYESIRDEVACEFDASHMSGRFKLVKQVLLGEIDVALAALPEVVGTKEVTKGELDAWPILKPLREHPDYDSVVASLDS